MCIIFSTHLITLVTIIRQNLLEFFLLEIMKALIQQQFYLNKKKKNEQKQQNDSAHAEHDSGFLISQGKSKQSRKSNK